jgi:glycosyltransferase involved in cell wall biosynthesis
VTTPEIAVVIPTLAREARLAFALEALAAQSLDRERFEVVVVRGAEGDAPSAAAPEGLAVRFLSLPGSRGAAAQRNLGWRSTAAPLVAFTDDDCRPSPRWLERLLDAARGPDAFIQGRTEPDPAERHLLYGFARSMEVIGPSEWHETCNIAYPRALLERLGGFDEGFEWIGDDTDLGLRALEAGAERVYVDRALVWHAVLPRTALAAAREGSRLSSAALMIARHPEQRAALFGRYFLSPTHATWLLAVAGLLAFRRRPLGAAFAIVPYLDPWPDWSRLPARVLARTIAQLPGRALVDGAEVVATARGAIRDRTLLL